MAPNSKDLLQRAVTVDAAKRFTAAARDFLMKADIGANVTGDVTATELRPLAENFLASIVNRNLLDASERYAKPIPDDQHKVLLASGVVAGEAEEAMPKAISRVNLSTNDMLRRKVVALIVVTAELLKSGDSAWMRLFRTELENSLIAASNQALLDALTLTPVAGTGDPILDLDIGLTAADDSDGYIVAAARSVVRSLALQHPTAAMSATRGGEFVPDVLIVPADVDNLIVIPASRLALTIRQPRVADASHATIEMSDTPTSPSQQVSLFQTNSRALAVERQFDVFSNSNAIEVTAP